MKQQGNEEGMRLYMLSTLVVQCYLSKLFGRIVKRKTETYLSHIQTWHTQPVYQVVQPVQYILQFCEAQLIIY